MVLICRQYAQLLMEITVETISEIGFPYEKYLDGIKDAETKKHYNRYLKMFLSEIPDTIYEKTLSGIPDATDANRAEFFVNFSRKYPQMGFNIIAEYIKIQKSRAELDEISPNTIPNYVKPIKVLLDQNNIPLLWKKLYNMYPREQKSKDRAYTIDEIGLMLEVCPHIVDKVIITLHASAGFRLEAWDFFTWSDFVIFKNDESGIIKGGALRIYRGDPEEYWTHLTPEACNYLLLYREKWYELYGHYPKPTDPLVRSPKYLTLRRLNQKGVRKRIDKIVTDIGLRKPLEPGQKRHPVKLVHGFRKFFNTMLRRAKVEYADKEKLMGHSIGLEDSYERYIETDFELFAEYEKAIPFLTISSIERKNAELARVTEEKNILKQKVKENSKLKEDLKEEKEARIKFQKETKQTLVKLRDEKLTNYDKNL